MSTTLEIKASELIKYSLKQQETLVGFALVDAHAL